MVCLTDNLDWLNDSVPKLRAAYAVSRRKEAPVWATRREFEAGGRAVAALHFKPPDARKGAPTVVYFHGGGWIVGSPETHADIARDLALACACEVVSVDYRLAPEFRARDQIEDALVAITALSGDGPIVLCGDSAGAAIALAAERAASRSERAALAGIAAFYGGFGVFRSAATHELGERADGLDRECLDRYWRCVNDGLADSPYAIAHLSAASTVPVYLLAANNDPLRHDTLALADALRSFDRKTTVYAAQDAAHGFLHDDAPAGPRRQFWPHFAAWFASRGG